MRDGDVYNSILKVSKIAGGEINVTDDSPYYIFERNDSNIVLGPVDASLVDVNRTKFY